MVARLYLVKSNLMYIFKLLFPTKEFVNTYKQNLWKYIEIDIDNNQGSAAVPLPVVWLSQVVCFLNGTSNYMP